MTFRDLRLRLRALLSPRQAERDMQDELRFHVDREAHDLMQSGVSPTEARTRARRRFGPSSIADEMRDVRGITFFESLGSDVMYALRSFGRTPAVAATVLATMALGLGLIAAVFTIFSAFAFEDDPARDPGSLFRFAWVTRAGERRQFTYKEYDAFRRENTVFSDVYAQRGDVTVRINGLMTNGSLVTGNFFQVLGVGAAHGRTLMPSDAITFGGEPVVVLGHGAWQRLFGGDPGIVGQAIQIRGTRFSVVGIAPEGLSGDFWAPLTMVGELERRPWQPLDDPGGLLIHGRLKPGLSPQAARSALEAWTSAAAGGRSTGILLEPRGTSVSRTWQWLLGFSPLFVAFGLVLLIACANIANLLLARAIARRREIATRLALGASRARVVRQLLTESLVLAVAAAGLALLVSRLVVDTAMRRIYATMPPELADLVAVGPLPTDGRVVVFVVVMAAVAAGLFGLIPALHGTRIHLHPPSLAQAASFGAASRGRSVLIVVQIAASALLLTCAGLLLRSAQLATTRAPGLRMSDTIVLDNPPDERARPELVSALVGDPTIHSVTAAWPTPVLNTPREVTASGARGGGASTTYRFVASNYFALFDIGIVGGRSFTNAEAAAHADVAVLSETAARLLWPAGGAVGETVRIEPDGQLMRDDDWLKKSRTVLVVGVVRDVRGLAESGNGADGTGIYLPATVLDARTSLVARARGDLEITRRALTEHVTRIEPRISMILTMKTIGSFQSYPLKIGFWITVLLGGLALMLTVSGIYSVLSYLVVQRSKEIGVRMALGATPANVIQLIQRQSMRLIVIGLAVGMGLVTSLAAVLAASLPPVGVFAGVLRLFDGVAYAGSLATILVACLVAASIPARRAARIDPMATLRQD